MCLVSIVIPTHGRPENLVRAVDSCMNQTYRNLEVIVVDDNDPRSREGEETRDVVMTNFGSCESVRYVQHLRNLNGSAARNTGVSAAHGELIAFLDDDDEFEPAKIAEQVRVLSDFPRLGCVYCRSSKYKAGRLIYETKYNKTHSNVVLFDILTQAVEINSSVIMIRADEYKKIGGFDEGFRRNQDYEFLARYLKGGELACVDGPLARIHVDSSDHHLDPVEYEHARRAFMAKFSDMLTEMPWIDRFNVWRHFYFDLAVYFFRYGRFFRGAVYLIKSLPGPRLIISVFPRAWRFWVKIISPSCD